ncbi:MAG: glycosyltransferase, partial [Luteolibacter sp.]
QALLYSAANLFVAPSLEEAFGQVFIEAAACGTPSVAYPVGGVPESLAEGIAGRLAKRVEPDSLAEAIKELYLSRRLRLNLGWWGRCHVENEFSLEASCWSLFFVLREAIRLGGSDLVPKLGLRPKLDPLPRVSVLLETLGFIKQSFHGSIPLTGRQIDQIIMDYYQSQLVQFRQRTTPWWLKPKAWLVKINRDGMRKKIARNERKQNRASANPK